MKRIVRFVWAIAAFASLGCSAQYMDEAQCFGGSVPANPTGVSNTITVQNTPAGNYTVTAWRQPCQSNANMGVVILRLQATVGSPSLSGNEVQVEQSGLSYGGMGLVKDPRASLLLNYQLIGTFTTATVILKQYSGARFDGNGRVTLKFLDRSLGQASLTLPAAPTASASASISTFHGNYADMWWNPAENGTGLSIIHHGSNQLFIIWYTYTDSGEPLWLVWPGGTWANDRTFTGFLYRTRGTPFHRPWDPAQFSVTATVGTATLRFDQADSATLTYSTTSGSGTKTFTRQPF